MIKSFRVRLITNNKQGTKLFSFAGAARYAYVGSELKMTLLRMKDFHNNAAFIPVQQYAEAGKVAAGEIEFEKLEKDSSKEKDIKALNRSMNKHVMSSFVGTKRTKRYKKKR